MLRLVTFDVVNTLLRVSYSAPEHYSRAAVSCGVKASSEQIGAIYRDVWKQHKAQHPLYGAYQGLSSEQFWRAFVHRVFNTLGHGKNYGAVDKTADILIRDFTHNPDMYEFLPNALAVLEQIKTQNIRLGIISNFDERLKFTLKNKQVEHFFEFTVTCIDAMAEKPDSRIFEHALRLAGVTAAETLHIGDDIERDYFAARRVGMKAILLNTNQEITEEQLKKVPKECVVDNLADIPNRLKELFLADIA